MRRTHWPITRLVLLGKSCRSRIALLNFNVMTTTRSLGTLAVSLASNTETQSLKDAKFGQCLIRQIVEEGDTSADCGPEDTHTDIPERVSRQLDGLEYFEWEKVYLGIHPTEKGVVLSKHRLQTSSEDTSVELPIGHARYVIPISE
jgi:hypothetical protein